jgi:hypothetical protein
MAITRIGGGAAVAKSCNSETDSTLSPTLGVTTAANDVALVYVTGDDPVPTVTSVGVSGYTQIKYNANAGRIVGLYAKVCGASEADPTVTLFGTHTNLVTICGAEVIRGANLTLGSLLAHSADQSNGASQTTILFPALTITTDNCYCGIIGMYKINWTSSTIASPPSGFSEIFDATTALSNDMSMALWTGIQTTATNISAGQIDITGGISSVTSYATVFALSPAAAGTVIPVFMNQYRQRLI